MGEAKPVGVLVMGRNLPSVDATCCRIMDIEPHKVHHLHLASKWLGPVDEQSIDQRGENIADVMKTFSLKESIPAQMGLRRG
jgi:uncharacterized protein (DUF362 family)